MNKIRQYHEKWLTYYRKRVEEHTEVLREMEQEPKTYRMGQEFRYDKSTVYKLVQVDVNLISLVSLGDGNAWHYPPTEVEDVTEITEKELSLITDHDQTKLTLIKYLEA